MGLGLGNLFVILKILAVKIFGWAFLEQEKSQSITISDYLVSLARPQIGPRCGLGGTPGTGKVSVLSVYCTSDGRPEVLETVDPEGGMCPLGLPLFLKRGIQVCWPSTEILPSHLTWEGSWISSRLSRGHFSSRGDTRYHTKFFLTHHFTKSCVFAQALNAGPAKNAIAKVVFWNKGLCWHLYLRKHISSEGWGNKGM